GAERLIFTVSDGTRENMVSMVVLPDPEYQAKIRAGWAQFEQDMAEYKPEVPEVEVVAQAQESLPAVYAQVTGSLAVKSNLDAFGQALKTFIARIPEAPETDQEFADTEAACKTLKEAEDRLSAAEDQALASLSDVEVMRRTVADLKNIARTTRLASEKLVKARKESIRTEIVTTARQQFLAFVRGLQNEITVVRLTGPEFLVPDFGSAIKGLKTLSSIRDRANTTLANAKIEASQTAGDIRAKVAKFDELVPAEYRGLFRDLDDLVTMAPNHFDAAVTGRVEEHKRIEAERLEQERARIEEQARIKAEREAQAKIEQEARAAAEAERARIRAEEEARAQREAQARAQQAEAERQAEERKQAQERRQAVEAFEAQHQPQAETVRYVEPSADEPATLTLGDINALLAPISLSAAGLAELGIEHSATRKAAKLYRESDVARICAAIIQHISEVRVLEAA
ncbi:MAG: hypothetical protein WCZ02_07835, partial [Lysobacterales bacterium]